MAWKAKLVSIPPTNNADDSFYVEVEYYDSATGRSFTQSFKFVAGVGLTLQQAQALVAERVLSLTKLDQTKALLIPYIGENIA